MAAGRQVKAALAALALGMAWYTSGPAPAAWGAPGGSTAAPAHVVELVQPGSVELAWSAAPAAPGAAVSSYRIVPVVRGAPCSSCAGGDAVGGGTTEVQLASAGATVTTYAVEAVGPAGASAWVTAAIGGSAVAPKAAPAGSVAASPWVAQAVDGSYTSQLDVAPPGWTRMVARDDGFSAPTADDGDVWMFADTSVLDTPEPGTNAAGPVNCFTANGTAAVAAPGLPPRLYEALQPGTSAVAAGTTVCAGNAGTLPAGAEEPYQLLASYPGPAPGDSCSNWVNGLTNNLDGSGGLTDTVEASYGSNCFGPNGEFVRLDGTWVAGYDVASPGAQPITLGLGPAGSPDLPPASCPVTDFTSYDGAPPMSGNYATPVEVDGYDYFYEAYGNSTFAFASLGVPEGTCSTLATARVPANELDVPADYQYLLPGGQWVSPAASGQPAATLASESADVMPADYDGAYAGQVNVARLSNGELAMAYLLPAPLEGPGGGTDVGAIRTASSPTGPWSAPAYFQIPGFVWGLDYQVNLQPDLSTSSSLALSYVSVTPGLDGVTGRQVTFASLPVSGLPAPGSRPPAGYRMAAADGGVFDFGAAAFYGSMGGKPLNAPIVGMTSTPDGGGYWLVAADGGIFAYGDATFYGSMGGKPLNAPIVGMTSTPDGGGYWLVAADGGIFAYQARFSGSMGGKPLNAPIVGLTADPAGGYDEVATDGGIFTFGGAQFLGSAGGQSLVAPVVAISMSTGG